MLQEPIMKKWSLKRLPTPGHVMGSLNQHGELLSVPHDVGQITTIEAQVPLSEMFGYSTTLCPYPGQRSLPWNFPSQTVPKSILETSEKNEKKKLKPAPDR
ncbi:MAG: hypothetical protein R2861_03200 [Desulfobacterales bacterium]